MVRTSRTWLYVRPLPLAGDQPLPLTSVSDSTGRVNQCDLHRRPLNDHAPGHLSGRRPHRPVRNPAVATRTGIKIEADGGVDTFKMDFIRARRLLLVMPVTADGVMHRAPARAWTLVPAAGSRLPRSRRMSGCINTAPAAQHLAAGGHPVVSRLQRHPGATTNIIRATGIFPSPPSRIPSPATGCRAWANPRRISGRRTGRRGSWLSGWESGSPRWPGSGASGIPPHRVETFKFSTDPQLEAKLRDVRALPGPTC